MRTHQDRPPFFCCSSVAIELLSALVCIVRRKLRKETIWASMRFISHCCVRVARSGSARPRATRTPCASGACGARAGTTSCITRSAGFAAATKANGKTRRTWLAGAPRRPAAACRSPFLRLRSIAAGCGAGRPIAGESSSGWLGRTGYGGAAVTMRASAPLLIGP